MRTRVGSRWRAACFAALVSAGVPGVAPTALVAQQTVTLGVLEYPQCRDSSDRVVRVLFEAAATGWQAVAEKRVGEFPSAWTIAFDGRARGTVTTLDTFPAPRADWYRRDRLLAVRAPERLLRVPSRTSEFLGWCASPAARPLVVVSNGNVADPDAWRPFTVTEQDLESALPAFRAVADSTAICPADQNKPVRFLFDASHLEAVRGYRDRAGRRIVGVRVRRSLYNCDGLYSDGWVDHWFELAASARFLGRELTLVDAGDYDGDGRSELVFWHSGYNRDGYMLYSYSLQQLARYIWSYH